MFERFTSRARHTIVLAQDEARALDHGAIASEHILLGLLGEPEAIAGRVLQQLGLTLEQARADVEAAVGRGSSAPPGHIPFTKQAKKLLELSLREALARGHNYIGTEHILLGLLRGGDAQDVAVTVLNRRGATAERIRPLIDAELARVGGGTPDVIQRARRTPGAEAVLATAEQLAAPGPVGSQHLLEAMALVEDSLAAGALGALGIEPEALAAKLDELGTEGTSDVSPEDAAARQMEVRLDDGALTIVLRDAATVQLGTVLTAAMGNPLSGDDPAGSPLIGLWQANVEALQRLVERVDPPRDPEPTGRAAIVQAAIRRRLRRRASGGG